MNDGTNAFVFHNGTWNKTYPFYPGAEGSAVLKSPFPNNSSTSLFAVGGGYMAGSVSKSAYVLTRNGWENLNADAPHVLAYHCMILCNLTSVWVTGGFDDFFNRLKTVFIFNSDTMQWTSGVPLQYTRYWHSCSMILKNNQTMSQTQIVVGGYPPTNSVEIFDEQTNTWQLGPQLPMEIGSAAIVNDANYGVILIGGYSNTIEGPIDTLYQLQHAASQWVRMKITLRSSRAVAVAFYISNNITNCT